MLFMFVEIVNIVVTAHSTATCVLGFCASSQQISITFYDALIGLAATTTTCDHKHNLQQWSPLGLAAED
jgi:hypothetical protein